MMQRACRIRKTRKLAAAAVLLVLFLAPLSGAQATWTVESLIPDTLSIRVPTTHISFELNQATYPPEQFPAMYLATAPEGGLLPVQVFSNAEGVWSLLLEIPDMISPSGMTLLSAAQVLYRVNGGVWLRADGGPQVVYTQYGPTLGWLEIHVEFAIELTGSEVAGNYLVNAIVSAIRDTGF